MSTVSREGMLRIDEATDAGAGAGGPLDLELLVGSWLNTDGGSSGGVLRFVISERDGVPYVRGLGVGEPEAFDWGEAEASPLAPTVADTHAWAFKCRFDFGHLVTEVSAYNKQGILVAAIFNGFDDDGGRADYWTREFFHREAGA